MADLKQAGVWLAEGKQVKRSTWLHNARIGGQTGFSTLIGLFWDNGSTHCEGEFVLSISDFQAEDWEIAE